jgi:hypothetical protein
MFSRLAPFLNLTSRFAPPWALYSRRRIHGTIPAMKNARSGLPTALASLWVAGFSIAFVGPSHAGQKHPNKVAPGDANSVVKQMLSVYQVASTIQESSSATFTPAVGSPLSQTYFVKYSTPNLISIVAQDPTNGTLSATCDGTLVTVYSAAKLSYMRRPAPTDLVGVLNTVNTMARVLTGANFDQTLNPISFLIARGTLRETKDLRYAGTEVVQGRKAVVLAGTLDEAYLRAVMLDASAPHAHIDKRDVSLYIDAATHVLLLAKVRVGWTAAGRGTGGKKPRSQGYTFIERHIGTKLSAPLSRSMFVFVPPPGASLVK